MFDGNSCASGHALDNVASDQRRQRSFFNFSNTDLDKESGFHPGSRIQIGIPRGFGGRYADFWSYRGHIECTTVLSAWKGCLVQMSMVPQRVEVERSQGIDTLPTLSSNGSSPAN